MSLKNTLEGQSCCNWHLNENEFFSFPISFFFVKKLLQLILFSIISGSISSFDDFREEITEPVRKSVIILVNKVNQILSESASPGKMNKARVQMRKSLPDITNPDSSDGLVRSNPDVVGHNNHYPPPLPPKYGHNKRTNRDSLHLDREHLSFGGQVDWFSNPLFENASVSSNSKHQRHQNHHHHHQHHHNRQQQKSPQKRYSNSR